MPITTYIQNNLPADVWNYLVNDHKESTYPNVTQFFRKNKNGDFFYEGTVRAQIAHFIEVNLPMNEVSPADWIVISEQPYPKLSNQRADIVIGNLTTVNPYDIIIEVKSDLNIESAKNDMGKMLDALDPNFQVGYMFFVSPPTAEVSAWVNQIEKSVGNPPYLHAIGISAG